MQGTAPQNSVTPRLSTMLFTAFLRLCLGLAGVLFTFFIAGTLRGLLSLSLSASMFLASILSIIFLFSKERAFRSFSVHPAMLGAFIISLVLAFLHLYHPYYRGLVSVGGGDSGLHAYFMEEFAKTPNVYHLFVAFYSTTLWLKNTFSLNTFEAFRAAYYLGIFAITFLSLLIAEALLTSAQGKKHYPLYYFLILLLGYFPSERILLPIFHYLQAEGFFPQFFGILPIAFLWWISAQVASEHTRMMFMLIALCLSRFSYGLNLPETLSSLAVLLFADQLRVDNRPRKVIYVLSSVLLLALSMKAYFSLSVVFTMEGGTIPTNLTDIFLGHFILSALFVAYYFSQAPNQSTKRAFIFPAAFTFFSTFTGYLYYLSNGTYSYYSFKQTLLPSVIATYAAIFLSAMMISESIVEEKFRATKSLFSRALFLALLFCGLWYLKNGYFPYQPSYRERAHQGTPHLLRPLADPFVWEKIAFALKNSREHFNGYITPSWPESSFTNSNFGFFGELPFYRTGRMKNHTGCVFWRSDPQSLEHYKSLGSVSMVVSVLERREEKKELQYRNSFGDELSISYLCEGTGVSAHSQP